MTRLDPTKAGPLPGFRNRGWPKTTKGGTFFKYTIGCMQHRGAKHEMGAQILNGAWHHWPTADDDPRLKPLFLMTRLESR